jgi:hypothetical protein
MHYFDANHIKKQKLIVTVYKDELLDCTDESKAECKVVGYSVSVESVQEARYIRPYMICALHFNIEHILREHLAQMENEVFYLVELVPTGYDSFKVKKMKKLTSKMITKDPFLGLH